MNTTTHSKTYNLSSIMHRAWKIYYENSTPDLKAVFSVCLKMSWAEAEGTHAEKNAQNVISQWNALPSTDQVKLLTACIRKAAKNDIGYSAKDNHLQYDEVVAWTLRGHDFDAFVSETWLRVANTMHLSKLAEANRNRALSHKRPISMISVIYNAARASIAKVHYDDTKHGKADIRTVEDDKGAEHSYVETMASSKRDNTELSAVIRADMASFLRTRDQVDAEIVAGLWLGLTMREIAVRVGMSHVAVKKRIDKMRFALKDMMAA